MDILTISKLTIKGIMSAYDALLSFKRYFNRLNTAMTITIICVPLILGCTTTKTQVAQFH